MHSSRSTLAAVRISKHSCQAIMHRSWRTTYQEDRACLIQISTATEWVGCLSDGSPFVPRAALGSQCWGLL